MLDRPNFPRFRRLRHPLLREMLTEVELRPAELIQPLFVRAGQKLRQPISSMPGVDQVSPDVALEDLKALEQTGVRSFILFGVVEESKKDAQGRAAHDSDNPVCETLRLAKKSRLELLAITDLCYCEYTSHGHCGVLSENAAEVVDNDRTVERLADQAVIHAQAGADLIAPSGRMDGGVAAIRAALDAGGLSNVPILSYAVKYASAFYGPFREAAESAPEFGDRRTYQMDPRRAREALAVAKADLEQGADILMVKPALPSLDVISELRRELQAPIAAYQVSGEYSMIKAAAKSGWLNEKDAALESLLSIKRAGADLILTYFARTIAPLLK